MLIGKLVGIAALMLLCFMAVDYLADSVVIGSATVLDGDSLQIGGTRVALAGIASVHRDQTCEFAGKTWPCGQHAAAALKQAIGDRAVTCRPVGDAANGERPCRCYVGTDEDLGRHMAAGGWAIAVPTRDLNYSTEEADARRKLAGIWSSLFVAPTRFSNPRNLNP